MDMTGNQTVDMKMATSISICAAYSHGDNPANANSIHPGGSCNHKQECMRGVTCIHISWHTIQRVSRLDGVRYIKISNQISRGKSNQDKDSGTDGAETGVGD